MPSAKSKPQEQKDQKKQKSLLGWLAKPAAANSSSSAINAPVTSSSPSGRDSIFETPLTKQRATLGIDSPVVGSATFTKSSDGGRSINETPPTSDPIDVDISSDEDRPSRAIKSARTKRKIAIDDSEDEECNNAAATHKGLSAYKSSKGPGKAKKARVTPSDDDAFIVESDDQDDTPSVFSQALRRFQKSPKKKSPSFKMLR